MGNVLEAFLKPDPLDNVTDGRMTLISSRLFYPFERILALPSGANSDRPQHMVAVSRDQLQGLVLLWLRE